MEDEKQTVKEAGGSSSSACGEAMADQIQGKQKEMMSEKQQSIEVSEFDCDGDNDSAFVPGPLLSLKEQIEKDKDDESLRRWKEKLLGCLESDLNGQMEPEVKFHSMAIISDEYSKQTNTCFPIKEENENGHIFFTLQEGSQYQLKLTFTVLHNIVSGLTYSNTVWKLGLQVEQSKGMLGTFAPQKEPYVHTLEEETTPSGLLARGKYSAKLKFEDDDRRCHMELKYSFEIKKRGSLSFP